VEAQGKLGKIPNHPIENLVQQIVFHIVELAAFDDELAVSDEGENLSQRQQVVDVIGLVSFGGTQENPKKA
jgi:hypothetical protein